MHDILKLNHQANLNGVKLNQLQVTQLNAKALRRAKKHPPESIEFETVLILSAFTELCEDDFEQIHVVDYIRMSEVVADMINKEDKPQDFLQ